MQTFLNYYLRVLQSKICICSVWNATKRDLDKSLGKNKIGLKKLEAALYLSIATPRELEHRLLARVAQKTQKHSSLREAVRLRGC